MTKFDEREHAFEAEFAHNEEIRFRVHAWRKRLLGLWAAEKLRLKPADAEAYATALAEADIAKFQDEEIVRRVLGDFVARGERMTDGEIRRQLERLLPAAKSHVASRS